MSLIILIGSFLILYLLHYIYNYYQNVSRYPRGPLPLPFIGNILNVNPRTLNKDIRRLRKEYGPVFTIFLPFPMVVIAEFDALKEAFVVKGDDYINRAGTVLDKRFLFCDNPGVINSNGDSWRDNRRESIRILRDFGMGKGLMEERVKLSISEYLKYLDNIEDKSNVDMRWPIQLMVANIINEILFGFRYDYDNCSPLIDYVEAFNQLIRKFSSSFARLIVVKFPWTRNFPIIRYFAITRMQTQFDQIMNYISSNVDDCMENYNLDQDESDCFVHAYMHRMGATPHLNKEQLYATCSDFFAAGQETTTTTLRWGILLLVANQDSQDRIRTEVLSVCGKSRLPSMSDRPKLPYTTAAVHEIQRRANIFMNNLFRVTTVDTELMGHKIPKGTIVNGDIHQIMAHDPIFENPEEFLPERYLIDNGAKLNKDAIERTVPFSVGKRQCAGEGLARTELFLAISATLQRYRILPSSNHPIDLTPISNFIIHPQPHNFRIEPVA